MTSHSRLEVRLYVSRKVENLTFHHYAKKHMNVVIDGSRIKSEAIYVKARSFAEWPIAAAGKHSLTQWGPRAMRIPFLTLGRRSGLIASITSVQGSHV